MGLGWVACTVPVMVMGVVSARIGVALGGQLGVPRAVVLIAWLRHRFSAE